MFNMYIMCVHVCACVCVCVRGWVGGRASVKECMYTLHTHTRAHTHIFVFFLI